MAWIVIIVIIFVGLWTRRRFSLEGRSKKTINLILSTYTELKRGGNLTDEDRDNLYTKVVRSLPEYKTTEQVHELFDFARSMSQERDGILDADVNLMWLAAAICVLRESRGKNQISGNTATRIYGVALRNVPEHL